MYIKIYTYLLFNIYSYELHSISNLIAILYYQKTDL